MLIQFLLVPALCYAVILAHGIHARRPAADVDIAPKEAPAVSTDFVERLRN